MIDYSPLWETMKEKNVSTYALIRDYNFSKGTLDSLKQNRNVTLNTIEMYAKFCKYRLRKLLESYMMIQIWKNSLCFIVE